MKTALAIAILALIPAGALGVKSTDPATYDQNADGAVCQSIKDPTKFKDNLDLIDRTKPYPCNIKTEYLYFYEPPPDPVPA